MDGARVLAQQFHRHGALAGDHVGIVVGVDKGRACLAGQLHGVRVGFVVVVAVQNDL